MKLVFLGPPGSGKGTQAKKLAARYGIPHISTGDIFRENIAQETELGKKVKEILDAGRLVPDDLTIKIVQDRLDDKDCDDGFILDGFPRTLYQAQHLEEHDVNAIFIEASQDVIVERLSGRLSCKCGAVFHKKFNPPKKQGICNQCHGKLYVRDDEKPEVVKKRIATYEKITKPVVDFYRKQGELIEIDGEQEIKKVFEDLCDAIDKKILKKK